MKLYTFCKSCDVEIPIQSGASTRPDLNTEKGELFQVTCSSCLEKQEVHINSVKAKANRRYIFLGFLISSVIIIALWSVLGIIGAISLIIPLLIWTQQSSRAKAFNHFKIKSS